MAVGVDRPVARFARLLPMSFTLRTQPDGNAARRARRVQPDLADVAERLATADELSDVRSVPDVATAIARLTPLL